MKEQINNMNRKKCIGKKKKAWREKENAVYIRK